MDYTAVAMAIRRFEEKAKSDRSLRELMDQASVKSEDVTLLALSACA